MTVGWIDIFYRCVALLGIWDQFSKLLVIRGFPEYLQVR